MSPAALSLGAAFGGSSGRSSEVNLPYFAVAGDDGALALSIAWSGHWSAQARVSAPRTLAVRPCRSTAV